MKKLDSITTPGIYMTRKESVTLIVRVTGKAPFLQLAGLIDFTMFVNCGMSLTPVEAVAEDIQNDINGWDWYEFDYIVAAETEVPVKKKADIKNPYNQKQLLAWSKVFQSGGEEACVIKIMEETDLPLETVQLEVIPRIKRMRDEQESA